MFSKLGNRQLAVLLAAVLSASLLWQGESIQAQDAAAQLKTLRTERLALLNQVVKRLTDLYATRTVSFDLLLHAKEQALQAKLELADSPEERIAVYRQLVENANQNVKLAEDHEKAGIGRNYEVLQAKARVLEFRIESAKEELKIKPAKSK